MRIGCIHMALRPYRLELFQRLQKKYDIDFIFTHSAKQHKERYNVIFKGLKNVYDFEEKPFFPYKMGFTTKLFTFLMKKKYDILITSDSAMFGSHIAYLVKKLTGCKLILFEEQWRWPKTKEAKLSWPIVKHILRKSDALVAAGSKAKEFMMKHGIPEEKIFTAFDTAEDLSKKKRTKKKLAEIKKKFPKEKKVFLYLSRIVKYKGLDNLIRSFARLEKERKDIFLMIGGHGPFKKECQELIKKLNIKNVKFVGNVSYDDVPYYYTLSDVFVLPTRFLDSQNQNCEAWGLVLNEVMSIGKPVIATSAVGAAFDLIHDGENGYLVEESNIEAMKYAMQKILSKKPKQMGTASKRIVKKVCNYKQMANGFINAIEYVR